MLCGGDDSLQDQRVFAGTMDAPSAQVRPPRPSASVMLWKGEEILVCHRVSEVPAFPGMQYNFSTFRDLDI